MSLPAPSREVPRCSKCSGVGLYYDPIVEVGRYGTLRLCECIECRCGGKAPYQYWDDDSRNQWCPCRPYRRKIAETNRLFRQAEIPEKFKWKFIDDFRMAAPDGTPIDLFNTVYLRIHQDLLGAAEEPERGYLLYGSLGTGKTLVGCIALNELMLRWTKPGRFLSLSRTFHRLRDTFSADSEHYGRTWPMLEELCKMPYLVLDDFGVQRGTDWEEEMLYDLVDTRYGDQRFTVVTTNQPLDELKGFAKGRIYSRLVEMCQPIPMDGPNYRDHLNA